MSSEKQTWQRLLGGYPGDFSFSAGLLRVFPLALREFHALSKGRWSLDHYDIVAGMNEDESYAAISFLPDPAYVIDGIPFEIADRGMYRNGMGVTYVFRLEDCTLVNRTYMR